MNVYINGRILMENHILEGHVLIADNTIRDIIPATSYKQSPEDNVIDLKGHFLGPGFVDVHIHGASGFDTMDGTTEAFHEISKILPHTGVTSYLAATMTMAKSAIHQSLNCAQTIIENDNQKGARLIGIHAEGPFVSEKYKGAQNPEFIEAPSYEFYQPYYDIIKLITIAPEEDADYKFANTLHTHHEGVVLSIGHSSATYDTAIEAFKNGYRHITHLFNAMTGLHHREPGIVGAALTEDFYTEIIADNVHVRPELYKLVLKAKGKDRIILITDAMCAAHLSPGEYELGGQAVIVDKESARLTSGVLAGSVLSMNTAIKNFYDHTDLSVYEAINLASKNPAEELGLYDRIGSIAVNKDADFVVLDDDFIIYETYCKGQLAYSKEESNAT